MNAIPPLLRIACAIALTSCLRPSEVRASGSVVSFPVVSGVCGSVVFVTKIAKDYSSALLEMEHRLARRQTLCTGSSGCRLEPFKITVEGGPGVHFFALKVIDSKTGMLDHGVSDVITSDGRLFAVRWCQD